MSIIMTWQCISPQVNVKGFKKCCTSNAVDGTDDNGIKSSCMRGKHAMQYKAVCLSLRRSPSG